MLAVLSPAKKLDYESPLEVITHTQPEMLDESQALIDTLRELSPQEIGSLMKLSDQLATLNFGRFEDWKRPFSRDNARQAIYAFRGDVYVGFDADTISEADLRWAQDHVRILSGLYGVLRPLDLIQPYRLEMGTRLATDRGTNLYQFWGDALTDKFNEELETHRNQIVVNLASDEYFKAINTDKLARAVISPVFKDLKNGEYKIISFHAKKARGMMARYIVEQRIQDPEELKKFDRGGYRFDEATSTVVQPVFLRDSADA